MTMLKTSTAKVMKSGHRQPDSALIDDALSFSKGTPVFGKVADIVSLYRIALETRKTLDPKRQDLCDKFVDEIEIVLNHYLDHETILPRKMRFAQVLVA